MRGKFLSLHILIFTNPNGGNKRNWVSKVVSKCQGDPTVNKSKIIFLLRHAWVYAKKERILEEEEKRMNLRGRESVETCCKYENLPNMSLFIVWIFWAYYLLYFLLFYKK